MIVEKKSIIVVEQNMNFNEVFIEHISRLPYNIGNFFETWDESFKYTFLGKLKNLFHRNILGNKNYIELLKEKQYDRFCKKCIQTFEKKFPEKFDYCIIFRADRLPEFLIEYLSKKSKKTIAYQYDGLSKTQKILNYRKYLDKIFVFDPSDLKKDNNLEFATNYHFNIKADKRVDYFLYYLGTWQGSRYQNLCNLLEHFSKKPNKITLCDSLRKSENQEITIKNKHIPFSLYLKDIKNASILIDIKLEEHDGLSFRFFEALNLRKKLITNNASVKNYNFYHPDNIYITDFKNFEGLDDFIERPYHPIPEGIVHLYSLDNWIKYILGIDSHITIPLPQTD